MAILAGCGAPCACLFVRPTLWLLFTALFCFYSFFVLLDFITITTFVVVFCLIFGASDPVPELGLPYAKHGATRPIIS